MKYVSNVTIFQVKGPPGQSDIAHQ
jgi:hypothetical protein